MRTGCRCQGPHQSRRIVLTGGPGAGKTAVLEVVRREFCPHVVVLPEAASIVFPGGFPRRDSDPARRAVQRAICRIQWELERMTAEEHDGAALVLCDRGTIDGMAYWPGGLEQFWGDVGSTREHELTRYDTVIHLRTPPEELGYNHANPVRVESARQAHEIDLRIADAWTGHPDRHFVDSHHDFMKKVGEALGLVRAQVPTCCRAVR